MRFKKKKRLLKNLLALERFRRADFTLFCVALALAVLGLLFLYSASAIYAANKLGDSFYYFKKQILWIVMGSVAMLAAFRADYGKARKFAPCLLAFTAALLVATLFCPPQFGVRRWIPLLFFNLQTSELAKFAAVFFVAYYFDRNLSRILSDWKAALRPVLALGVIFVLIALEPDIGTPVLMFAVALIMFFTAGVRLRHILAAILLVIPFFVYEIFRHKYRLERLKTFLSPWSDSSGSGYQIVQSILAAGSGGWLGKGLGASRLKLMYIPEPHTDFIFPIIAEEIGFVGSSVLVLLFAAFMMRGLKISRNAPDLFSSLLALGITLNISLQSFFNIAMSLGIIPTKGLPLPFFSYGGSLMIMTLFQVGLLLNISSRRKI